MDEAIDELAFKLSKSHQEATKKLKKVFDLFLSHAEPNC